MRILMINSLYPPIRFGGGEQSVALLAEALGAAGEEMHVATLHEGAAETRSVERGVTVHRLPLDNHYWAWPVGRRPALQKLRWHLRERWNRAAAARVDRLLARVEPDLVHTQLLTGFGPGVWPVVKARGLPLVQTLRDYSLICSRAALFKRGRLCARQCGSCRWLTAPSGRASREVDALIGNSDYLIDAHRRAGRFDGVAAQRLFNIVPGGGDRAIAVRTGPPRFGFLGRIEPEKGIETLLAASRRLGGGEWRLAIGGAGDETYRRHLRARFSDTRIEWLGRVEAAAFYRSIDVLVIPSLWPEPLPRTLIEAAAHGRSIIAARSGGIPEAAAFARHIVLYDAGDSSALAGAMRAAIDDPASWRSDDLQTPPLPDEFSAAHAVAAHRAIYARVLGR